MFLVGQVRRYLSLVLLMLKFYGTVPTRIILFMGKLQVMQLQSLLHKCYVSSAGDLEPLLIFPFETIAKEAVNVEEVVATEQSLPVGPVIFDFFPTVYSKQITLVNSAPSSK